MTGQLFQGELVKLVAMDPTTEAEERSPWSLDSEYQRMLDAEVVRPWSPRRIREAWEKREPGNGEYPFSIRTLEGNRLIGSVGLEAAHSIHGDAWVWIGIGDREAWGKGYGTDAMCVILRYAFDELNRRRVCLNTFEYNHRALGLYQKLGFVEEGRVRKFINRGGRRWDMIYMGLLKEEWIRR